MKRRIPPPRGALALLALALAALLALGVGCERRSQPAPPPDAAAAHMIATGDLGAQLLLEARVPPDQSVMRALRGATDVETAYGGAFVAGMLGRTSDLAGQRDWFLYVDGVEAGVGASEVTLATGDTAWWDHRFWGGAMRVPAVVGLWPEPFAGAGTPVRADVPLAAALTQAGVALADDPSPWRVRVGAQASLAESDPAWRRASADPDAWGLLGTVGDGRVTLLDAEAGARVAVPGARALVAAVPTGAAASDGVLLAVAGLDEPAARAAAERIAADPSVLRLRFAVAFDGAGNPLRAAGRAGP